MDEATPTDASGWTPVSSAGSAARDIPLRGDMGYAEVERRGPESAIPSHASHLRARLRDVAGDAGHGVDDVAREQGKRAEDRDRDDSQDDAVLGHRLPVFTSEPVVELLHRSRPPWLFGAAKRRG